MHQNLFQSDRTLKTVMENTQEIEIPDIEVQTNAESVLTDAAEEEPMSKKLKREMQCPVCDQIPTIIPIPACSMGHIVCRECKDKIPISRQIRDKPCPICRSPLDENTSYVAGQVVSLFTDIPCSYKNIGCSFEGSIDSHKAHNDVCMFKMVVCFVCEEECMRKDFSSHNNECFLKSANNTFRFPGTDSLYLVQVNPDEEILVETIYVNNEGVWMGENGIDYVGFNTFSLKTSTSLATSLPKMKIVMKSPTIQIEATSAISKGPYMTKKMWDTDLVLAARKEDSLLSFEIIGQ